MSEPSTIHDRFLAVADAGPARLAALSSGGSLTYAELADRALAIASELRAQGVEEEELVGISVSRGINRVASVLGILCAGAAYVPLEESQPLERLREIVEDAQLRAMVTDRRLVPELGGLTEVPILAEECTAPASREAMPDTGPDSLAYVIYTSGTTGQPNGVEIPHRGVLELTEALDELLCEHSVERVLQFSALGFDISVHEMIPTLLTGRSLWVLDKGLGEVAPEDLLQECHEAGVDMVTVPPSYLMAADEKSVAQAPRVLGVGGERCPPALVERWASRAAFYNFYGPTEVTVEATRWRCSGEEVEQVPIGLPYPHVRTALLTEDGVLEGPGRGELYLGGPLARGYLNRPELTAERFKPVQLSEGETERMYATGDVVERREDGALLFVGRADRQIKLRGQRLELSDVEAALRSSPEVDDAVVLGIGKAGLADRLVAFVRIRGEIDPKALKEHVSARRPRYMVPTQIIEIAAWPLTSNGKIDYKALEDMAGRVRRRRAPRDSVAPLVTELWAEMLEVDDPGPDEDFFDLGGHSLLAVRLVGRLRRDLGIDLPVEAVYESPTLAAFTAEVVTELEKKGALSSSPTA
jgi:amino acid adenylation domain-containing protein